MNIAKRIAMIGLVAGAWMGFSSAAFADTVFLKDGREVDGTVVEDNNNTVSIKLANGVTKSYRRADVDTVVYERKGTAPKIADAAAEPRSTAPGTPAAPESKDVAGKGEKTEKGDKKDNPDKKDSKAAAEEKDDWTPPDGLPGFPDHAKRMSKDNEKTFLEALDKLASSDEAKKAEGKKDLQGLGPESLPYCVAGIQHASVDARTACMTQVGALNGRSAIKQVIEVFYAAMPDEGRAATWQVPFIRATINTVSSITGQTYVSVEPKSELVQNGLKQYIDWYNANFDRLPPQLGEKKIDATDPDYTAKLKKARALVLTKKSWPRPEMPADMVGGDPKNGNPAKPAIPPGGGERDIDKAYKDSYQKVDRDNALKRPQDR